jgi:mevalonate pyrophosphate decarboxylase
MINTGGHSAAVATASAVSGHDDAPILSVNLRSVSAQACHPVYGGYLSWYEGDALNCADIGYQVVEVWDVNNDPYNLDTLYGPGNGWTCDSYS